MNSELLQLQHAALIELYEIDLSPIGFPIVQRFCNDSNPDGSPLVWRGHTFTSYPLESSGFEKSRDAKPGNPEIRLSNIGGVISALTKAYAGLVGAQLRRFTVFSYNLDGMPGANSLEVQDYQIWSVSRYSKNDLVGTFSLKHSLELSGVKVPRRRISSL